MFGKSLLLALAAMVVSSPARAGQFTVLHTFDITTTGEALLLSGSTLYGNLINSPVPDGNGSLYAMNTDGSDYHILRSFTEGKPLGSMVLIGSTLFGTTGQPLGVSRPGIAYSIHTDGTGFQSLITFDGSNNKGAGPSGGLTAIGTTLYGTTTSGGDAPISAGTVYAFNSDGGSYHNVVNFQLNQPTLGGQPQFGVSVNGSTLFGTSRVGGGFNSNGQVFSVNTDGSNVQYLHQFGFPGGNPQSTLVVGSTLFGTTLQGNGSLYSMNTDGSNFQVLHAFGGSGDGKFAGSNLVVVGSTIVGTTQIGGAFDAGTIWSMNLDGSNYQILYSNQFDGIGDIGNIWAADGNRLFGVSSSLAFATVFSFVVPEPSGLCLGGLGFLSLAAWRWQRGRRRA